ncbi:hypothetical protein [Hyphomonas sp.]|uniref:amidohydrolase family protein n=1 Tax=Hyphomonas sp. TaxID=87 RepID=UPI0032EE3E89
MRAFCWTLILLSLAACETQDVRSNVKVDLALTDVVIVDPVNGTEIPNQTVLIRGNQIVAIGSDMTFEAEFEPEVSHLFVAPAPIDSHVHIYDERDLAMYAAYGIRTVRNMDGWDWHLKLREEVAGDPLRAQLLTTGSQFQYGLWESEESLFSAFEDELNHPYDWVKVYDVLSVEDLHRIADMTDQMGRQVTGHLPDNMDAPMALNTGAYHEVAHSEEVFNQLQFVSEDWRQQVKVVADIMVEKDIALATTLVNNKMIINQIRDFEGAITNETVALAPPLLQSFYTSEFNQYRVDAPSDVIERVATNFDGLLEMTAILHEHGVELRAGTDAPNPITPPGDGLLQEIELLHEAGLTPAQAYAAALPRDLGAESVVVGASANLVILAENPLDTASALYSMKGAVRDGVFANGEKLVSEREALKEAYARDLQILSVFSPISADPVLAAIEAADDPQPISREAMESLAWMYMKFGNEVESRRVAVTAIRLYPDDAKALWLLERFSN